MSVQNNIAGGESVVLERPAVGGVYASLFEKINLNPVSELSALDIWQDAQAMSDATADERLTAGMQVFLECLTKAGSKVEKLDKSLIDHHIAELDYQISRQLDAVMHHEEFQAVESLWRGVKSLVDKTDFRQNVKIELLSMSKEELRQDFEDSPEIIQSGLYKHAYIDEYDTPGGEPIAALISAYEFDASAQDVALLRNISKVSAAAHMPFIGSAGPKFFLKESMEDVAAIKDIGNYFDRAEYIKWKSFRDTDDARYIGLVMPRVLGRLPYGPDTVPVRSFNYVEEVKGPDHDKYLWTNASFAFASNMVRSFINNGWCVQIRGPQAGGAVQDLPIHLYDLGTGNQVKIPSEVMIPETREFEFANLGFIPLSYYKNRDYACFFSANSAQKPALYDTADATANSRINARLPYIFLLSRIAHYRASMGQQLVMEHYQHGYMPLAMLSDGLRNMVATVSDIAFRCIKLNPHLKDEAAQKTAGIVLIDEVDMFLHPAWQQQVLGALQEAFPLLQFIVTTHSPQVLTTVAKENIRQLGSDEHGTYARMPPFSPLAHENSDALAKVMETHSQPSLPLQETISEYELLVRSGEETSERATTLLATLEQAGYQFHESDLATWRFLARRKLAAKGS